VDVSLSIAEGCLVRNGFERTRNLAGEGVEGGGRGGGGGGGPMPLIGDCLFHTKEGQETTNNELVSR